MVFSLFFFSACSGEDDPNYMKIFYRPYASSKVYGELGNTTYAELIEENIYELSDDILTSLVGAYGPTEFNIMDGLEIKHFEPDLNGVDFKSLFGYGALSGVLSSESDFGQELNSMTNLYFSSENKLITLSQGDFTSSDILDIVALVAQLAIPGAVLDNVQIVSGSISDLNALLRISTGDLYYYVFYGGKIAGKDYINSANNFQNAKNYFTSILNTNFNVIEKDFCGLNIVDESSNDLNFAHWKYNLLNGNLDNQILDGKDYCEDFLEKYSIPFAAHVAKAMLVGGDDIPSNIVSNGKNLASLYQQAKSGDKTNCQNFIKEAVNYIDHIGLTDYDIQALLPVIKNEVIGHGSNNADKIYENSEKNSLYKNNYDTIIPQCLNTVKEENPQQPILEYITVEGTYAENVVINGYVTSVILMSEEARLCTDFIGGFILDENVSPSYIVTVRHSSNGTITDYPVEVDEESLKDGNISFSLSDTTGDNNGVEIAASKKGFFDNEGSILKGNKYELFVYSKQSDNTKGHAWCYNDLENEYVEIVFATKNVFENYHIDINCFGG